MSNSLLNICISFDCEKNSIIIIKCTLYKYVLYYLHILRDPAAADASVHGRRSRHNVILILYIYILYSMYYVHSTQIAGRHNVIYYDMITPQQIDMAINNIDELKS